MPSEESASRGIESLLTSFLAIHTAITAISPDIQTMFEIPKTYSPRTPETMSATESTVNSTIQATIPTGIQSAW